MYETLLTFYLHFINSHFNLQTLTHAGFSNDPRVAFYKLHHHIYKRILIIFRTPLFAKC